MSSNCFAKNDNETEDFDKQLLIQAEQIDTDVVKLSDTQIQNIANMALQKSQQIKQTTKKPIYLNPYFKAAAALLFMVTISAVVLLNGFGKNMQDGFKSYGNAADIAENAQQPEMASYALEDQPNNQQRTGGVQQECDADPNQEGEYSYKNQDILYANDINSASKNDNIVTISGGFTACVTAVKISADNINISLGSVQIDETKNAEQNITLQSEITLQNNDKIPVETKVKQAQNESYYLLTDLPQDIVVEDVKDISLSDLVIVF